MNAVNADIKRGGRDEHAGEKQEIPHPAIPLEHKPAGNESRSHRKKENHPEKGAYAEAVHQESRQIGPEQARGILHGGSVHADGLVEGGVTGMIAPETEQHEQTAEKKKQSEQFAYQSVSVH